MGALTNPIHLAFIAMIALIILGPKRLPETLSFEHHDEPAVISASGRAAPPLSRPAWTVPVAAPAATATIRPTHGLEAA